MLPKKTYHSSCTTSCTDLMHLGQRTNINVKAFGILDIERILLLPPLLFYSVFTWVVFYCSFCIKNVTVLPEISVINFCVQFIWIESAVEATPFKCMELIFIRLNSWNTFACRVFLCISLYSLAKVTGRIYLFVILKFTHTKKKAQLESLLVCCLLYG